MKTQCVEIVSLPVLFMQTRRDTYREAANSRRVTLDAVAVGLFIERGQDYEEFSSCTGPTAPEVRTRVTYSSP